MALHKFLVPYLLVFVTLAAADSHSFDYFLLVREWNPTLCGHSDCSRTVAASNFTIHGLWPQRRGGSWPSFCNPSATFDEQELTELLPELKVEWPALFNFSSDIDFWTHEWLKHGTCSETSEKPYFEQALRLHRENNILDNLLSAGIQPSDTVYYSYRAVVAAITADLGVRTQVHVYEDRLSEVWMCISKDLQPFDCPHWSQPAWSQRLILIPKPGFTETERMRTTSLAITGLNILLILVVAIGLMVVAQKSCKEKGRGTGPMWSFNKASPSNRGFADEHHLELQRLL